MDNPNHRSSHLRATPRAGGLSFVLIGTLINFLYAPETIRWIPVICLPLATVGLIDDFRGLQTFLRYSFQLLTSIFLVIHAGLTIFNWQGVLLVIAITGIINFTNFMDGLDGLVAGCGVLLMASTSCWALSGAILGFLIWNWSPAKIFMGDVGSTFIGAVYCGLLITLPSYSESLRFLLIGFPLYGDAFSCVIRRFLNKENIFQAHRKHLFQRLYQAGWKHQSVATLYISAVGILLFSNIIAGFTGLLTAISIQFIYALYLDKAVASQFQDT